MNSCRAPATAIRGRRDRHDPRARHRRRRNRPARRRPPPRCDARRDQAPARRCSSGRALRSQAPSCVWHGSKILCLKARSTWLSRHWPSTTSTPTSSETCSGVSPPPYVRAADFVLADVVAPELEEDAITPIDGVMDLPDRADDQLEWLREAGLDAELLWSDKDLAVMRATRPIRPG